MKTSTATIGLALLMTFTNNLQAGPATTSATAGSNGWGPGTASATAGHEGGGIGFARTNTRSGRINFGQGISLGLDANGLSFSTSYAVAPTRGPAVAGTFNLGIGLDGSVSRSVGRSVATGDRTRSVNAGGFANPGGYGRPAVAGGSVGGRTGPRGAVTSRIDSQSRRPRFLRRNTGRHRRFRR
ncbi:MAG: hypothetical protein ACE5GE_04130 [Phycisphaerae bacterium]